MSRHYFCVSEQNKKISDEITLTFIPFCAILCLRRMCVMGTSAGAKKAWKTIRAKASKRSLAAKKANETRGQAGRRAAAVKAWKTMRGK